MQVKQMLDGRRLRGAQKNINVNCGEIMKNTVPTDNDYSDFYLKNGFSFPDQLKILYKDYNGFSGIVGQSYVSIFPLNDLFELNKNYEVDIYFPGFVLFGSDGGGEAYGFVKNEEFGIYRIPFVGMCNNDKILITNNVNEFIHKLEHGEIYE
jgi:hypothetical protein